MRLRIHERGVAVQVGVAILLAFLVLALTLYQVNVVPQQNQATEYQHSQSVHEKLQEVRNAVTSVPGGGSGESVAVPLGTSYRSRTFALNPPDPAGSLTTTAPARVTIDNAVATGSEEVRQFWNGTEQSVWTRGLAYRPKYNEYRSAPATFYENTVLFDRHENATVTRTDQVLIRGNTITLVALNGTYSRSTQGTVSVDLRAASTSSRAIAVSNETGSNVTITIPSRLPVSKWQSELLSEESAVTAVSDTGRDAGGADLIEITLRQDTYRLRMAKVGIGSDVTTEESAYVTDVRGDGSSVQTGGKQTLTVEVRDRFNNPVAGRTVEANVTAGGGNVVGSDTATTDAEGQASFTYNASSSSGTAQVAVNLTGRDPPRDYEQVTFTVYVESGGNDGGGNQAPNADAGSDRTVSEGDRVALDGTGSSDPDGDSLDYEWTQTAGPSVSLQDSTTPTPEFDAPSVTTDETLTFELTVTDPDGLSDTDSVSVVVQDTDNQAPTADPGGPYSVEEGNSVELDGTGSSDPDDSIAAYSWRIVGDDYGATLSGTDTATPTFDAPDSVSSQRTVTVELTVTDQDGATDTAQTDVTIERSDTSRPTIVSSDLPDREIDNEEAGNNLRQNLTVEFNEDMDQSVRPSIAFENVTGGGTDYTIVEQSWTGARTYQWEIEYQQNGADTDVTVNVSDAQDLAGNRMAEETALTFTFDANPPGDPNAIRILTDPINRSTVGDVDVRVTNPSTIEGDETVEVQFTGPNGGTKTVSEPISSGTYTYLNGSTLGTLDDGNYVVAGARLVDDVGNTNPSTGYSAVQSNQVTKDTVAPSVEQFDLSTVNDNDLRVSLDVSEKIKGGNYDYERIEVRVTSQDGTFSTVLDETDFSEINSNWVYNATITGVADGNYTAEVRILRDIVGNDGTTGQTDTATVDTTAPSIDVTDPADGATVSERQYEITASVTDALTGVDESTISVTVEDSNASDGIEFDNVGTAATGVTYDSATGTLRINASDAGVEYGEGTVDVTISADDRRGNTGQETSSFTVDVPSAEQTIVVNGASLGSGKSEIQFDIVNNESGDVTLTDIALNSTTNNKAERVESSGRELSTNRSGFVDSAMIIDGTIYDVQGDTPIPGNSATRVTIGQFGRNQGSGFQKANMKNTVVKLTLYFADGTHKTVEITVN